VREDNRRRLPSGSSTATGRLNRFRQFLLHLEGTNTRRCLCHFRYSVTEIGLESNNQLRIGSPDLVVFELDGGSGARAGTFPCAWSPCLLPPLRQKNYRRKLSRRESFRPSRSVSKSGVAAVWLGCVTVNLSFSFPRSLTNFRAFVLLAVPGIQDEKVAATRQLGVR